MSVTARIRGRVVAWSERERRWCWEDTGEPAAGWGGPERPCPFCGLTADPADDVGGGDPCLGLLRGVESACCGHGVDEGWIGSNDGRGRFRLAMLSHEAEL